MNPSKPNKNAITKESLSSIHLEDELNLKLEIWENEGGAIDQTNVEHKTKEE